MRDLSLRSTMYLQWLFFLNGTEKPKEQEHVWRRNVAGEGCKLIGWKLSHTRYEIENEIRMRWGLSHTRYEIRNEIRMRLDRYI